MWDRWYKDIEEFSETIKTGRVLSEAWWCKMGRLGLVNQYQGDTFNYTGWYMNMKNRFGWADKTETKTELSGVKGIKVEIKDFTETGDVQD